MHARLRVEKLKTSRNRQLASLMHKRSLKAANILVPVRVLHGNDKIQFIPQRLRSDTYVKGPVHRGDILWNWLDAGLQHTGNHQEFNEAFKKLNPLQMP